MKKLRSTTSTLAAASLAAAVAGCSRSEPEVEPAPNAVEESLAPIVDPAQEPPATIPEAEPTVDGNATAELPAEAPTAPDEQMMDDASATGMTARTSRGEEDTAEPPVGNAERE